MGPGGAWWVDSVPGNLRGGEFHVSAHADDMILVPRAELDALRAENRRLRREAGDREAVKRIRSDSGEGRTFTRDELAEAWGISE